MRRFLHTPDLGRFLPCVRPTFLTKTQGEFKMLGGLVTALASAFAAAPRHIEPIIAEPPPIPEPVPAPKIQTLAPRPLKSIELSKLCTLFADSLRDAEKYGYFIPDEIDEDLTYFCEQHGFYLPDFNYARACLKELPGVFAKRYRLKTRFPEIAARTGADRRWLYRISSHREMERHHKRRRPRVKAGAKPAPVRSEPENQRSLPGSQPGRSANYYPLSGPEFKKAA